MTYSKYAAKPVTIDNVYFHSAAEGRYYTTLRLAEQAEQIRDLECQVPYDIVINGHKVCRYVADFRYYDLTDERWHVVDVKGRDTPVSALKRKLLAATDNIVVEVVSSRFT